MTETELKFQIPPQVRPLVRRAVATPRARVTRLQAVYVDTADRRLAAAGLALRLRREGRRWVQTLKGRGDGLMERLEHELVLKGLVKGGQKNTLKGGSPAMPALDVSRHAGVAVGDRLLALLADAPPLVAVYATDIQRTHRVLRVGAARIELAHDRGVIRAAGRTLPVEELEFELLSGTPAVLAHVAACWVQRFGLWWDVRTKSERGHRLAAGASQRSAVLCDQALVQALANGAELAEGLGGEPHAQAWRAALAQLGLQSLGTDDAGDAGDAGAAARSRRHSLALLAAALS
jgi:inorganic triphosphatase YgiF